MVLHHSHADCKKNALENSWCMAQLLGLSSTRVLLSWVLIRNMYVAKLWLSKRVPFSNTLEGPTGNIFYSPVGQHAPARHGINQSD